MRSEFTICGDLTLAAPRLAYQIVQVHVILSVPTNRPFLFNHTVELPFCSSCPWDGWGLSLGTLVPSGVVRTMFMCCDPDGLLENRSRAFGPGIGNLIGPKIGPGMKIGKKWPKNRIFP